MSHVDDCDQNQLREFVRYTSEDYARDSLTNTLFSVNFNSCPDGQMVGSRLKLDRAMFFPKIDAHYSARLVGIGRRIALQEIAYLGKVLADDKRIRPVVMGLDKVTPELLLSVLPTNGGVIFAPISGSYGWLRTQEWLEHATFGNRKIHFGDFEWVPVPSQILQDKIIVMDRNAIRWSKRKYADPVLQTPTDVFIDTRETASGDIDAGIVTFNKIDILAPDRIRIISLDSS